MISNNGKNRMIKGIKGVFFGGKWGRYCFLYEKVEKE